jgi:tol-pal system protein YbgF
MRQLGERVDKVMSDMEFRLRRLEQQAGIASDLPEDAPAVAEPSLRQAAPMLGGSPAASNGSAAGTAGGVRAGAGPESGPGVLAIVPRSELDAETAGLRSAIPQPPPQSASPSPPPPSSGGLAGGSPQEQYAYAFSLLQAAQYDEAEQALEAFLLQNPDHMLADNARYWLGETFYVRGQYPEAAQQFVDAYQKNRSGAKSGDALLKLGMSLSQLGKTDEACATFRELSRTQPDAPETVRNKAAQEAQRTGCS